MSSKEKKGALDHYFGCWCKFAVFSGRAGTDEFWGFFGINIVVNVGLGVLSMVSAGSMSFLSTIYGLAVLLPMVSVGVRRFHDCGRGGIAYWCYFLLTVFGVSLGKFGLHLPGNLGAQSEFYLFAGVVGVISGLLLLVNLAMRGEPGNNAYGKNPEPWNALKREKKKKGLNAQFSMCLKGYRKYADFSGRASRSEFWGFFGLNLVGLNIAWFGLQFIKSNFAEALPLGSVMMGILTVMFVPMVGAGVRRFHDCDRTLGDYLCYGVPLWVSMAIMLFGRQFPEALVFAAEIVFVLMLALFARALASSKGTDSNNRYGKVVE